MTQKPIIVIGGGISGITTAIEAAEVGYEVVLVEKLPYLGGRVIRFHEYFPKLCPPYCGLEINFKRIRENPRIKVNTSSVVKEITGNTGNYSVKLVKEPEYINRNCTACGECEKVCPVDRPNEYNYNMDQTRAVYLPHELAFPFRVHIDAEYCKQESCGRCLAACKYDAIDFNVEASEIEINAGAIVYTTGWEPYPASKIKELQYKNHPDIITNVEFERLTAPNGPTGGKLQKPSNSKIPDNVIFIQCAGSRDVNHLPYCSAVCCSASLKHALKVREIIPHSRVNIFYIDLRVTGRNEDFLNRVKNDDQIYLVRGKAGKIEIKDNKIIVIAEDIKSGKKTTTEADLVVLATGIMPSEIEGDLVLQGEDGFLISDNGILSAGCAKKPMDVSASLKQATGTALKAIQNTLKSDGN